MVAKKCRIVRDFVQLSLTSCRFSSTVTGEASKYVYYVIFRKEMPAESTGIVYARILITVSSKSVNIYYWGNLTHLNFCALELC